MFAVRRRAPAHTFLAAAALLSACSRGEEKVAAPAPAPAAPPVAAPTPPLPPPPLGRGDIIRAAAEAADAFAAGSAYPERLAGLAGRRFRVRLVFGCAGPTQGARLGYAYDAAESVLRLTAKPEVWTGTPLAALAKDAGEVEAVEGYWLRRPWLSAEACPAAPVSTTAAPPVALSPESVGLVRVFEAGGSRLLQRGGRPYEVTRKADPDPSWKAGFRLVLEGRIAEAEGRPVRCRSAHPDQRPTCLVRVEFDRVAFETAKGDLLAEWSS